MAKHKYDGGRMPNEKKGGMNYSDTDSGSMGSNSGASTGLRKEDKIRPDTLKAPSNKNPFPNGMA